MLFLQRTPAPPLDRGIAFIWVCRQPTRPLALERVLPTGAAQLIINLREDVTRTYDPDRQFLCTETSGTILTGVQSSYQVIDTSEQEDVAGVAFRPGGTRGFARVPSHEIADLDIPLDDLWRARLGSALRARVLEAKAPQARLDVIETVLREHWTASTLHPAVAFALATFHRAPAITSIARVTEASGLSPKRFVEHFKREVGLTPKRYCRVRRFQRVIAQTHRGRAIEWAQVAADCGYFDQAHLIHEFRSFAGITPVAYESSLTAFQNHVRILADPANAAERAG